jgi:hypothetical protein
MKKIDVGQSLTLLANVGVLAGLLLLVYELNQNREITKAQLRSDYADQVIGQLEVIYANPELAELMFDLGCVETTFVCESVAQFRFDMYWDGRFRSWESLHFQYRSGLYDDIEFQATTSGWKELLTIPRVADHWEGEQENYSPEFVELMNGLLLD